VEETLVTWASADKAEQEETARVYDCGLENYYLCVAVVHWSIFINHDANPFSKFNPLKSGISHFHKHACLYKFHIVYCNLLNCITLLICFKFISLTYNVKHV